MLYIALKNEIQIVCLNFFFFVRVWLGLTAQFDQLKLFIPHVSKSEVLQMNVSVASFAILEVAQLKSDLYNYCAGVIPIIVAALMEM